MQNIHPEFAYQSRELAIQIEDTLGDPPNRKNLEKVVQSLIGEYANGSGIDDVNFFSFALAEHLQFNDSRGLLAQAADYEQGESVMGMVTCADAVARKALTTVSNDNPELARKAVITAFLFKNHKRWKDDDHSLESLQHEEDMNEDIDDEDQFSSGQNIDHLFDTRGDGNA